MHTPQERERHSSEGALTALQSIANQMIANQILAERHSFSSLSSCTVSQRRGAFTRP